MAARLPTTVRSPWSGEPLAVSRAWPRDTGHVLLELETRGGLRVAAEWWADPDRAADALAEAPAAAGRCGRTLLLPDGADRRLHGLAELVAAPSAVLVAHRPGRRAVVRHGDGSAYSKVVRRARLDPLITGWERARARAGTHFTVPPLRAVDVASGRIEQGALPGRTLLALGADPDVPDTELQRAWRMAGAAVRQLHDGPVDAVPTHTADDEAAVATRWLELAAAYGLLPPVGGAALLDPLLSGAPGPSGLLHRDLHDQQLLVSGDGPPGLLDVDTLAAGERALDAANFLVHLELRWRQALLTPRRARIARDAFLDALRPDDATLARVPPYAAATRLRLAGVYAFRPRWRALARELLTAAVRPV